MLVDSHCHLDFPDFADERDAVIARAVAAGVGRMVTISTRVKRFPSILKIAESHEEVYCSVGTHPHNAAEELDVTRRRTRPAFAASESCGDRRSRPRLLL